MRICTITWNPNTDDTRVKYTKEFLESDWIVRADVLVEAHYLLEDKYLQVLDEVMDEEDKK